MPKIVTPLKLAFAGSTRTQREVADEVGIDETKLSRIVNGHVVPDDATCIGLAEALGKTVEQLWPTEPEMKAAA